MAFRFGEAAGDLVEQQHSRFGRERPSELKPFALQQGETTGRLIGAIGKPGLDKDIRAAGGDLRLALARDERRSDEQVLEHGQLLEGLWDLESAADAREAARHGRRASHVSAGKDDGSVVGGSVAGDKVEQCRLARAVRPDDAKRFAFGQLEGHPVGDLQSAKTLGDVFELQNRHVCHHGAPGATSLSRMPGSDCLAFLFR
jgi:hypothetical protein